ncbi:YfcE family phosphodiesterase [candidate division KSB3 bacterium]|uniref:Phosphoesterase n=1 Tax=candidate division KSB3 bacterium TaxID=2044937 RepID=A0A9D5Q6K1_9BACT|nr:YfcE family phosphodiesterase [candidate division KSB3 bacterium]MBD3325468.1 YfcE family phosphodiesterase [candidate division KSB3 bacterium]
MKIGVLSDTHLKTPSGVLDSLKQAVRNTRGLDDLHELLQKHFGAVDLIIHAGDFVDTTVVDMLEEFAPVEAVQGNMDTASIRRRFPVKRVLSLEGYRLGLMHGDGGPQGIIERVRPHFSDVDAIIFGHTHHPVNERRDGILLFNPGSPTDRIFAPYPSLGILEIADQIRGSILKV